MPLRPLDGNGLMHPWRLRTPPSAASRKLFPPEKVWSGPLRRRQDDLRIFYDTRERMTSKKGQRWTLLACNSPGNPGHADPSVNPKSLSAGPFSLLLRLWYLFEGAEFAPFRCNLGHPSPFLCAFYHYAASKQGIMDCSHL